MKHQANYSNVEKQMLAVMLKTNHRPTESVLVDGNPVVELVGDEGHAAGAAGDAGAGRGGLRRGDLPDLPGVDAGPGPGPELGPPPEDLAHGLRLVQHRVRPAEAVEPLAHAHVRPERLLQRAASLLSLLAHGLRAQAADPAPGEPAAHAADVLGRALLRHAAALALGVLHLGDGVQLLLLRLLGLLRCLLILGAVLVVVELVGDVGHGALEGVGRGPAPLLAVACGRGGSAADVSRHRQERRRHGHGDRARLSAGSHVDQISLLSIAW
jgi:hypothetical protein